jgi:hypothetical protein
MGVRKEHAMIQHDVLSAFNDPTWSWWSCRCGLEYKSYGYWATRAEARFLHRLHLDNLKGKK